LRQPDYDQGKENNDRQILLKIKALEILKIEKKDKCWRKLENMVIFWKEQAYMPDSTIL